MSATVAPAQGDRVRRWSLQGLLRAQGRVRSTRTDDETISRYCRPCEANTASVRDPLDLLHVLDFFGHRKEGGMAIDFAVGGFEQRFFVARTACHDVGRLDHPNAEALVTTGIDVARIIDGHLGVRSAQAAYMLVSQSMLAAN